jgi:hypothetical protein
MNLQHTLKLSTLGSLGHKRKWQGENGIRYCNSHIKNVINDKQEAFKKLSTVTYEGATTKMRGSSKFDRCRVSTPAQNSPIHCNVTVS